MRFYTKQHQAFIVVSTCMPHHVPVYPQPGRRDLAASQYENAAQRRFSRPLRPIGRTWSSASNASSPGTGSPTSALAKAFPSSLATPST